MKQIFIIIIFAISLQQSYSQQNVELMDFDIFLFDDFPADIKKYTSLKKIVIPMTNSIKNWEQDLYEVSKLPQLEEIQIDYYDFLELSDSSKKLITGLNLFMVYFKGDLINNIEGINKLTYLDFTECDLFYSQMESIFEKKIKITVDYHNFKIIPYKYESLVTGLDFSYMIFRLKEVPEIVFKQSQLLFLNLGRNKLTYIPIDIENLEQLEELFLYKNDLSNLPPEIGNLTNLTELNLTDNYIEDLPTEIKNLQSLKSLWLTDNLFKTVPPEIFYLHNLTYLGIGDNRIKKLPVEFRQLKKLFLLSMDLNWQTDNTQIFSILSQLENLKSLLINMNNLRKLPVEIGDMSNLSYLYIEGKKLKIIPHEIGNLTNLINLSIKYSSLKTLPAEIGNLLNLDYLNL